MVNWAALLSKPCHIVPLAQMLNVPTRAAANIKQRGFSRGRLISISISISIRGVPLDERVDGCAFGGVVLAAIN